MFDKLKNSSTSYEPYKYIMQDTGSLYIGARYTYQELLDNELLGFKMKAIISQYILKEADPETTLESQFYYLTADNFVYKTYEQLKVRVKVQVLVTRKTITGRTKSSYREKIYPMEDLVNINLAKKKGAGMMISEIIISKLSLMSFTV